MYDKVLIPVDGSDPSIAGLREVIQIVSSQSRQVRLVHIVDEFHWNKKFDPGSIGGSIIESIRETGKKILNEAQSVLSKYGLVSECILVESQRCGRGGPRFTSAG